MALGVLDRVVENLLQRPDAVLGEHDRARAIAELILKFGAPAEGSGAGPAFRLRPAR